MSNVSQRNSECTEANNGGDHEPANDRGQAREAGSPAVNAERARFYDPSAAFDLLVKHMVSECHADTRSMNSSGPTSGTKALVSTHNRRASPMIPSREPAIRAADHGAQTE